MNCQQARSQIALWVGGDLDASAWECVQSHLHQCPGCQSYQTRMKGMLELLGSSDDSQDPSAENELSHDSLWPALSAQLPKKHQKPRANEFNGWIPALALAAVCMVMVFAGSQPPRNVGESGWTLESGSASTPTLRSAPAWFGADENSEFRGSSLPVDSSQFEVFTPPKLRPQPRMIFVGE